MLNKYALFLFIGKKKKNKVKGELKGGGVWGEEI